MEDNMEMININKNTFPKGENKCKLEKVKEIEGSMLNRATIR